MQEEKVLHTLWVVQYKSSKLKQQLKTSGFKILHDTIPGFLQVEAPLTSYESILKCKFNIKNSLRVCENIELPPGVKHISGLSQDEHKCHTNIIMRECDHLKDVPFVKPLTEIPKYNNDTGKFETNFAPQASSYTVTDLINVYKFPAGNGANQTIGIISLGGGYKMSDVELQFASLGLSTANLTINDINVGAGNNPGDTNADLENALDLQIVACCVPNATVNMYFAPNSGSGFNNALYRAGMIDNCNIVSISWGLREKAWNPSELATFNATLHAIANKVSNPTTVFAASGDYGSSDGGTGNNVNYPASSPFTVGCGGTTLIASGGNIESEVVWNQNGATGGGLSDLFSVPDYQTANSDFNFEGKRGVPDVAGNANPNTGWKVFFNGNQVIVGGTSAVSPFYAGLFARINQNLVDASLPTVGFIQNVIYPAYSVAFNDIITGNNGAWYAEKFWDAATGLGSPIGDVLQQLFMNPTIPIARFATDPSILYGETPFTVQFTSTSVGTVDTVYWDFDDGTTSNLPNPIHTFINDQKGTKREFYVRLTVSNADGSTTTTQIVSVTNEYDPNNTWPAWQIALVVIFGILFVLVLSWAIYALVEDSGRVKYMQTHDLRS